MIINIFVAIVIVFTMLTGWVVVQHLSRRFAARHPEFGPAREEGSGCGSSACHESDMLNCPLHQAGLCELAASSGKPVGK